MAGLVPVSVRLLATTATVLALSFVLASCGSDEEVAPAVTSTATPGGQTAVTFSPATTLQPGATVTTDWATFDRPDQFGQATFRYPADWFGESNGGIHSSNPADWPSVCAPPGEMGIQASVLPVEQSPRPKGATDYRLGTYAGWELVERNTEGCVGRRAHTVALEREGMLYIVIFYSDSAGQEAVFQQILATLQIPAEG